MENGRTVSAVRERLGDASSSVQEEFGRRIREMDTDPGAHLLRTLGRSEYVLKTAEYRAVGEWDHASYLFDVLHIGHRSRVYA
jgi:mRNA-degrading endonuclease RelE of RelBE toxin-antitoxin system